MRWLFLLFWVVLCFAVAGLGGRWTAPEVVGWYRTLVRPSIAPPNWIFAPVWTLLYALMAIAVWRITLEPSSPARTFSLVLFVAQLVLNLAWSYIFFRAHLLGGALVEIVVLWVAIGLCTLSIARVDALAAGLMAPYWAWVSFATILNAAYWRLNR